MKEVIGIKFCGNCNPYIDTDEILKHIKSNFSHKQFVYNTFEEADILLILSACRVDCATRPCFSGPIVVVAGEFVNSTFCPENQIADVVTSLLNQYVKGE
jgi:hypothetical protein